MPQNDLQTHWLRFKRDACPKSHAALCDLYDPLRLHTAERMLAANLLDRRIPADDYAEFALPALLQAIALYDPERTGHDGKPLNPRNWVIYLLRQAMKAHSERETKRLSILAPVQVIDLADGAEHLVELVADPTESVLEQAHLSAALSRLPYLQREAIRGVYVEGRTSAEVASILKIKASAMRRHVLPKARAKIIRYLGDRSTQLNTDKTFFPRRGRPLGKRLTERIDYRDTPEGRDTLIRLAEARGVSVPEVLRQLTRAAAEALRPAGATGTAARGSYD